MNLPKYNYQHNHDFTEYAFESEGPKGIIRKRVVFTVAQEKPVLIYNLAFGDIDADGNIDDAVISNNEDRDKVLATVANSVNEFCDKYGNHLIFVQGSNPSRTRLYQMGLAKNLAEIQNDFQLMGLIDIGWQPFQKNVNYKAFLANRKQ